MERADSLNERLECEHTSVMIYHTWSDSLLKNQIQGRDYYAWNCSLEAFVLAALLSNLCINGLNIVFWQTILKPEGMHSASKRPADSGRLRAESMSLEGSNLTMTWKSSRPNENIAWQKNNDAFGPVTALSELTVMWCMLVQVIHRVSFGSFSCICIPCSIIAFISGYDGSRFHREFAW